MFDEAKASTRAAYFHPVGCESPTGLNFTMVVFEKGKYHQKQAESSMKVSTKLKVLTSVFILTGTVFTIRKYTLGLITLLLLFFPMVIVCFPGRPEPYKVCLFVF